MNAIAGHPGDGRSHLLAGARVVWPDPARLTIRRRRGGSGADSYLVLPSLQHPVLLLPESEPASANVLRRHSGRRGKLLAAAAMAVERRLLSRLPVSRLIVERDRNADRVEDVLFAVLGNVSDVSSLVVRLGRRRFDRAVVLQALDTSGAITAFIKLGSSDSARELLGQQYEALAARSDQRIPGLRAPEPLAYLTWQGTEMLVISPLIATSPGSGRKGPPINQMRALAAAAGQPFCPLFSTPIIARLDRRIDDLSDEESRTWLRAGLRDLIDEWGHIELPVAAWHGDWVSWNMTWDGDEVLLWDWEQYDPEVLAGMDHIHYLAQELRMRVGTSADVEDTWLDDAQRALQGSWGLEAAQASAVVRTYLLEVNLRYVLERQSDPVGPGKRNGWGRPLVERLGRQDRVVTR